MICVDMNQFAKDSVEEIRDLNADRTGPLEMVEALGELISLCTRYINLEPDHYRGLCSWMHDEGFMMAYEVIACLRKQEYLANLYGTKSYVDETEGCTADRLDFAHDLRLTAISILWKLSNHGWNRDSGSEYVYELMHL